MRCSELFAAGSASLRLSWLAFLVGTIVASTAVAGRFEVSSPEEEARIVSEIRASHFLAHATFGPTMDEIKDLAAKIRAQGLNTALNNWIDEQFALPATSQVDTLIDMVHDNGYPNFENSAPINISDRFRMDAWWHNAIASDDQLRQRIAWALSQIFVVNDSVGSNNSRAEPSGLPRFAGQSHYYDIFVDGATDNYREILEDVSKHPIMGLFLTHLNNRKADPIRNTYPDENYARECMQLFTIGLYKVKDLTGEYATDRNGNLIPTYDNDDIDTMARVFTGWSYRGGNFGGAANYTQPMANFTSFHDTDEKVLLDGTVLRARRTGTQNLDSALDVLFNQPETPPFVSRKLIQRFTHSNPTPKYVGQVARRFFGSRRQPRGDMKAIVKAILLSGEARNLRIKRIRDNRQNVVAVEVKSRRENYTSLREPVLRVTSFVRAFGGRPSSGTRFHLGDMRTELNQSPHKSPSVFNFYSPEHQPPGPLSDTELVAPEFEILTSVSVNEIHNLFSEAVWIRRMVRPRLNNRTKDVRIDMTPLYEIIRDEDNDYDYDEFLEGVRDLLEHLDILLCHGTMSTETADNIYNAIRRSVRRSNDTTTHRRFAAQGVAALVLTSPDCAIED